GVVGQTGWLAMLPPEIVRPVPEYTNNLRMWRSLTSTLTFYFRNAREALSEEDRSHHQAVQARRGEGSASGSRSAGDHGDRGQRLRTAERSCRTVSWRGIYC